MGVGPSAILGSTNKFFMPWLVPRNQKDTVYAPSIFGKLSTGRKRREIETSELAQEVISCKSKKLECITLENFNNIIINIYGCRYNQILPFF